MPEIPEWVDVIDVEGDLGPATKILPASRKWSASDVDLLLCDDDRIQDRHWIARFASARRQRPNDIICERGWNVDERFEIGKQKSDLPRAQLSKNRGCDLAYRLKRILTLGMHKAPRKVYEQAGYADVFEGFLGVLIPPKAFHEDAWDIPNVVWTVDDVWLSGMAKANGVNIWVNAMPRPVLNDGLFDRIAALKDFVEMGVDRSGADRLAVDLLMARYGIWQ